MVGDGVRISIAAVLSRDHGVDILIGDAGLDLGLALRYDICLELVQFRIASRFDGSWLCGLLGAAKTTHITQKHPSIHVYLTKSLV